MVDYLRFLPEEFREVLHIPVGQLHVVDPPGHKEGFTAQLVVVHPPEDAEKVRSELSDPVDDRGLVQSVFVVGAMGDQPYVVVVEIGKGFCA